MAAAAETLTASYLYKTDSQLKNLEIAENTKLPSDEAIEEKKKALEAKKHKAYVVNNGKEALELIKTLIPKGSSVMSAGSITLQQIGYSSFVTSQTDWRNLHGEVLAEKDQAKATQLRRKAMAADYFISSVTAVTKDGVMTVCDASGSRVGGFGYAANQVIVVLGANKIVANYDEAVRRTEKYCLPLESARVRVAYKLPASSINNFLAINSGSGFAPGRYHVIIVKEALGY